MMVCEHDLLEDVMLINVQQADFPGVFEGGACQACWRWNFSPTNRWGPRRERLCFRRKKDEQTEGRQQQPCGQCVVPKVKVLETMTTKQELT